jgi:hypothetical protein
MSASKPPAPPPNPRLVNHPYDALDPIPQPDVVEKSSETTWELWHDVQQKEQARYADTVPLTSPGPGRGATRPGVNPAAPGLRPAAGASGADLLMQEARRNNRVCPQPAQWRQLHDLLCAKAPAAAGARPGPPFAPGEWKITTSLAKRLSFRSLLDWAIANRLVEDALRFVRALPEEQWHHMGE